MIPEPRKARQLITASLAILLASPAPAQQNVEGDNIHIQRASAAFECAFLAMQAGDVEVYGDEVNRLLLFAYEEAITGASDFIYVMQNEPSASVYLRGITEIMKNDFVAGMIFAMTGDDVREMISSEVPYTSGLSHDTLRGLRSLAASREFHERNCRLIGQ